MKRQLYSIKDELTGFTNICEFQNDEEAERAFAIAVQEKGSMFNMTPEDYSIYHVGERDTESGLITPVMPVLVIKGRNVIRKETVTDGEE